MFTLKNIAVSLFCIAVALFIAAISVICTISARSGENYVGWKKVRGTVYKNAVFSRQKSDNAGSPKFQAEGTTTVYYVRLWYSYEGNVTSFTNASGTYYTFSGGHHCSLTPFMRDASDPKKSKEFMDRRGYIGLQHDIYVRPGFKKDLFSYGALSTCTYEGYLEMNWNASIIMLILSGVFMGLLLILLYVHAKGLFFNTDQPYDSAPADVTAIATCDDKVLELEQSRGESPNDFANEKSPETHVISNEGYKFVKDEESLPGERNYL